MKIKVDSDFPELQRWMRSLGPKVMSAAREAINQTADWVATDVGRAMRRDFDRPKPFTLRSLRVYYAKTGPSPEATVWFRQRSADRDKSWAVAQIAGGQRDLKPMELRLQRSGLLPAGWLVVPGAAAPLDSYGNMSRGEISRILNVLGTYTEAGYNKANDKTRARLRKGNAKKDIAGFEYWVNPVGPRKAKHLLPGVYRRVYSGARTELKPMLVFVNRARYRARLDYFGIVESTTRQRFPTEFDTALQSLIQTGSASGLRRARSPGAGGFRRA